MSVLCHIFGHRWVWPGEMKYEQGRTLAVVGGVEQEVGVTWVCDEVCSRCGAETWWPT